MQNSVLSFLFLFLIQGTMLAEEPAANWELLNSFNGVDLYARQADCYSGDNAIPQAVLLKIVNHHNRIIQMEWDLRLWYEDPSETESTIKHNGNEKDNHYIILLKPGSTVCGNCDKSSGALYICRALGNDRGNKELLKFELKNIRLIFL